MVNRYSDIEIIKHCKQEDPVYQKALVMQYSEFLFATCIRYMGNEEKAKDILQDSFIKIFKSIKNFNPEKGSLKNYMCKICINTALKKLSKNIRHEEISNFHHIESDSKNPLDELHVEYLFELIRNLKEPYRTVFNLHEIEGYPHKDIAEILTIQVVNSRSILSRAKAMLRKKINNLQKQEAWI